MFTAAEVKGARSLLSRLEKSQLILLAETVTNKQIRVFSRQEAENAIITYSTSSEELLRRRRISRTTLFQYLAEETCLIVSVTSQKHVLIQQIINHWRSGTKDTPATTDSGRSESVTKPVSEDGDNVEEKHEENSEHREFALQFIQWFYQMLNVCCHSNSISAPRSDQFGAHHFYVNCRLRLLCHTSDPRVDEYTGSEITASRLRALICEETLYFNVNPDAGSVSMFIDIHGLRTVVACGTVHHGARLVALFEQQFGVARDPSVDNKWRIKFTNLQLRELTAGEISGHQVDGRSIQNTINTRNLPITHN